MKFVEQPTTNGKQLPSTGTGSGTGGSWNTNAHIALKFYFYYYFFLPYLIRFNSVSSYLFSISLSAQNSQQRHKLSSGCVLLQNAT